MKTTSLAVILLAGFAAFSGVARADETVTAGNLESARVARESAAHIVGAHEGAGLGAGLGAGVQALPYAEGSVFNPLRHLEATPATVLSQEDRAFLKQGDRGIGLN